MRSIDEQPSAREPWVAETELIVNNIRKRGFGHVMKNNSGYLSQICSAAEIFALLYNKVLNIEPAEPHFRQLCEGLLEKYWLDQYLRHSSVVARNVE